MGRLPWLAALFLRAFFLRDFFAIVDTLCRVVRLRRRAALFASGDVTACIRAAAEGCQLLVSLSTVVVARSGVAA